MSEKEAPEQKTGWQRFWLNQLSTEVQIILTIVFVWATILLVGWIGLNEQGRMEAYTAAYEGRSIENGAAIFQTTCTGCHGPQGKGIEGVAPALNAPDLFNGERLAAVGYTGSLEAYVRSTVAAGRPTSTDWPNPMPTWSQEFGGPLRNDQIQDVTNYVLNWAADYEDGAADVAEVEESESTSDGMMGQDLEMELPEGDAANGEVLFKGELGCFGCHLPPGAPDIAPDMNGISSRAGERVEGLSTEEYIRESIQVPCSFVAEADTYTCLMPQDYGDRLTPQDLADLIAYLLTLD